MRSGSVLDLVGEGHLNGDGSSRQDELGRLKPGDAIKLVREPTNPHDPNAIAVQSSRGVVIGYLSREDAAVLSPTIDSGRAVAAGLHEIRGGVVDFPSYGCRICIAFDGKALRNHRPLDEAQRAFRKTKHGGETRGGCGAAAVALCVLSLSAASLLLTG
jgi:hypothetical protein